ncbi:RNA methyltransferase [Ascidiimonas aurantiaca]|uniref:TrmH family RNA methyltransferase n=1 Tax=Ascidiimonas aurantiaca TaxID=1685432 RepID=UPI0030EF10E6
MIKEIESLQNPLIKKVISLREKSRERKKHALFIIEGKREVTLALQAGYELDTLLFWEEFITPHMLDQWLSQRNGAKLVKITPDIYRKLAYRESTEGIIAIAKSKDHKLQDLKLSKKNTLVLVAEAPEKPGNIGALLRTADAAALDAVIIANPKTDLYNPNIIRSSVGGLFTVPIATGTTEEIIAFLNRQNIAIYAMALTASIPYYSVDFTNSAAIVVGTEATGLSASWINSAKTNIIIPMQGKIDSINVSVAAAIPVFEAKRQRILKNKNL